MKKGENVLFDVTIGPHDGEETCELVGIYLPGKLSNIINNKNIGLYKDHENANGPKLDCLRKNVIAIFYNEERKMTIDTNLTTTDFLDRTLHLFTGKL